MKTRLKKLLSCLVAISACAVSAEEKLVILKNGDTLRAQSVEQADGIVTLKSGGKAFLEIPKQQVVRWLPVEPTLFEGPARAKPFPSVSAAARAVEPACVLIRHPGGSGSGFLVSKEGLVVTNAHVIDGSTQIEVTVFTKGADTLERKVYKKVEILATAQLDDLALLRIMPDKPVTFPIVRLGVSESLNVGDAVFAIGNPLGLERTVTTGIVSLALRNAQRWGLSVQHTAPISSGNSGGALFNQHGEVVGINTFVYRPQVAENLGFARPVNVLREFLNANSAFAFDPSTQNNGVIYHSPAKQ